MSSDRCSWILCMYTVFFCPGCGQLQSGSGGRFKAHNYVRSSVPGNLTWLAANVAWTEPINLHQCPALPRCWVCIWTSVASLCREWKNIINTWIRSPFEPAGLKPCDLALSWDGMALATEVMTLPWVAAIILSLSLSLSESTEACQFCLKMN